MSHFLRTLFALLTLRYALSLTLHSDDYSALQVLPNHFYCTIRALDTCGTVHLLLAEVYCAILFFSIWPC